MQHTALHRSTRITVEVIRGLVWGSSWSVIVWSQLYISTLEQINLFTCCFDHMLLIVMLQVQPLANPAQIEEEQWWDIDRDELPADRPVYQDFN